FLHFAGLENDSIFSANLSSAILAASDSVFPSCSAILYQQSQSPSKVVLNGSTISLQAFTFSIVNSILPLFLKPPPTSSAAGTHEKH
ncbi:MAG TPA: hypothetical protein PLY35_12710, partial [Thermotogota bacterium]|nr:hypothetical protein [Thermotogota bacterium]